MTELLRADIHQKVFATGILAVETLDRVLHRRRELPVGATELLKEHISESGIRLIYANGVHELLDVMVHVASSVELGPNDPSG
ncbi:hypothetical protein FHX15_006112 [Rhizobium sp. BK650]|nr:hypothetical protein [Rhizobium sp. BK650]